jgi:HEAT repeat protein
MAAMRRAGRDESCARASSRRAARRSPLRALAAAAVLTWSSTAAGGSIEDAARALAAPRGDVASKERAAAVLATAASDVERRTAVSALARGIHDPAAPVRVAVANALGTLADERGVAALILRMEAETDEFALAAEILAVGTIGRRPATPSVLPYADHRSPRIRAAAATALGDLGGEDARRRLLALLGKPGPGPDDDADWGVRSAAMLALSRAGKPEDAGTILVAYRDGGGASSWFARCALAQAVAALDSNPVPVLDRLMADDDPRVSSTAGAAFVRAGYADEVVKRLGDAREGVRAAAASAVAAAELRTAIPRLKEVATTDAVRAVRWSAALALSRLDDPLSDALLVQGVASDDPSVWAAAVAEARRKTGLAIGRDPDAWKTALAERRARSSAVAPR